jgi:glycosyltransferase involved in cell wall biosynthesis
MAEEPFVSIVTPVYNGEDYLEECIESVLAQHVHNFEYIIVNNRSTDRSLEIAQRYARKDPRIRVHDNDTFVGVIDNHNIAFGLISPRAAYCKVVSADDYIFPEYLSEMLAFGAAHPSVGIIGCYQLSGAYVKWQGFEYPKPVFSGRDICRRIFLGHDRTFGFGTPTSLLYRADLVRSTSTFYPNSSPHADTSACFQYLHKSDFGFVYQVLSYERIHAMTQSTRSAEMNRYSSAILNDLIQYGPYYLSGSELEKEIGNTLKGYDRFLAVNWLIGFRDEEFWTYHRSRLEELGHPLTWRRLARAALVAVLGECLNLGSAAKRLEGRLRPKAEAGSRGTSMRVAPEDAEDSYAGRIR